MTFPTPTGQAPTGITLTGGGDYNTQLNTVLQEMRAKGDTALATQFQSYANGFHIQNPGATVQQTLDAFLATELGGAIGTTVGGTGAVLGQVPGAAATGAENAVSKLDSLGGFNLGSWFMRVGEILLGLVLIGVGIARITGAQNIISKAVKTRIP